MSGKLTDAEQTLLEDWIGTGPKTFTLLYSADTYGECNPATFHQQCDNKGPTVTVLYNPQGSVYGAYTSEDWDCTGQWKTDNNAFLFQLRFSAKKKCTRFCIKTPSQVMYCGSTYGPHFGHGNDLYIFNSTIKNRRFIQLKWLCQISKLQ